MNNNYFADTPANEWCLKTAFQKIEINNPGTQARSHLRSLKEHLTQALGLDDAEKVAKATKWLQKWEEKKKELVPKQSNNSKRDHTEVENNSSSGYNTWNTNEKPKKKRKYLSTYLSSFYGDSGLGVDSRRVLNEVDMTSEFGKYRQTAVEGAQMRKLLSNARILSLSYIFLLSSTDSCMTTKLPAIQQNMVTKAIKEENQLSRTSINLSLACRDMYIILSNHLLGNNEVEDALDAVKLTYKNDDDVRVSLKVINDLLPSFTHINTLNNQQQGEASLIIDNIKPYLVHCLISKIDLIKYDWLTYTLNHPEKDQVFKPDFVLFLEDLGIENFEFLFVEVKRKGNYHNNNLEDDLVKLGKQMQVALNKFVKRKVKSPEVMGILVIDRKAIVYKMDLKYDGQYRMMEINSFHFARDSNDVLLMPNIIESMKQVCSIVKSNIERLYKAINGEEVEDVTAFTRKQCDSPVMVNHNNINED